MSNKEDEPLLGLATTEELFKEIIARFEMLAYHHPSYKMRRRENERRIYVLSEMLGWMTTDEREYRTVDS